MQYLNNDIEKLMRKAAREAPVKAKGADWDKIAGQLQQPAPPEKIPVKRDFKKLLLLLPLLLAGFVCDRFFWLGFRYGQQQGTMVEVTAQKGFENVVQPKETNKAFDDNIPGKNKIINTPLIDKTIFVFTPVNGGHKLVDEKDVVTVAENKTGKEKAGNEAVADTAMAATKNEVKEKKEESVAIEKAETIAKKKKHRFYISTLVALDFSTIKFQKIDAVGYGGGVKAGFNINNKWALETGLLWQHKEYYTKAEHFKTDKIYLPQNVKMINANGYCEMLEIPLDVRYNFRQDEKSKWFAVAGLSTYLMLEEDYDYLLEKNGQQYSYGRYYNKPSQYFLSIVNMATGYEHKVGRLGSIRIEPYIKLPLKGMGVGSLPLTSGGINVGFTHTF